MQTTRPLSILTSVGIALASCSITACTRSDDSAEPHRKEEERAPPGPPRKIEVVEPAPDVGGGHATAPAPSEEGCADLPGAEPTVPWDSLRIAEVSLHQPGTVSVLVPADRIYSEGPLAETTQLSPRDTRVPASVRSLRFHLVSRDAPTPSGPPTAIELISSMYDGDSWRLSYSVDDLHAPTVAVDQLVSPMVRIRLPIEPVPAHIDDPLVVAAASTTPKPKLLNRPGMEVKLLVANGTFPKCANRLVVVNWTNPIEHETEGVMFTIDPQGEIVQDAKLVSLSSISGRVTIDFLGDLDGDGYDEVGWTSQWIESGSTQVTRFGHDGIVEKGLDAWGH